MAKRLFGTDGIRGTAGQYPLDPATVTAFGIALGADLQKQGIAHLPVLIGMDTRESGPSLAAFIAAGLPHEQRQLGIRVGGAHHAWRRVSDPNGPIFRHGVMISASHNPFEDNGIKVFARTGFKLPDDEEHEVEEAIFRILPDVRVADAPPLAISTSTRPYLDFPALDFARGDAPVRGAEDRDGLRQRRCFGSRAGSVS